MFQGQLEQFCNINTFGGRATMFQLLLRIPPYFHVKAHFIEIQLRTAVICLSGLSSIRYVRVLQIARLGIEICEA